MGFNGRNRAVGPGARGVSGDAITGAVEFEGHLLVPRGGAWGTWGGWTKR